MTYCAKGNKTILVVSAAHIYLSEKEEGEIQNARTKNYRYVHAISSLTISSLLPLSILSYAIPTQTIRIIWRSAGVALSMHTNTHTRAYGNDDLAVLFGHD
jgi:hypothetical protein